MGENNTYKPVISKSAYIHPSAVIIGNVEIGANVFVGPNAVIRSDEADHNNHVAPMIIEDDVNIQDNVVIHALAGSTLKIGKGSSVSHSAIVHGPCEIGKECFIGFGSVVFKASVGDGTVVMHKALVENAVIPEKRSVPSGTIIKNDEDALMLEPVTEDLSAFAGRVRQNNLNLLNSSIYKKTNYKMNRAPKIAVVMGSKSDMDAMKECINVLDDFGIPHEVRIISAHRTPERAHAFAREATDRGLQIVIAAAGKSAHLAGVMASMTTIPVIGVPMQTSDLGGLDSLFSVVQMPGGVPVATTAIGRAGAKNAALLAISILSLNDNSLNERLKEYRRAMQHAVEMMDDEVCVAIPC
ncbi:5-(carboxyamino)imidazole ribonucleotide mutase [Desulforegula conservatrix]|uniref:5-(carboxyamino)imidazole ribonucleotide mutase n=1 Tax=Desulforegula conservatrix TaxID=153026 RepID=UPI00041FCACC